MFTAFVHYLNKDGVYALKNESNVMDLSTAYEKIPGFELIVNC